jgi:tight adherence protein B
MVLAGIVFIVVLSGSVAVFLILEPRMRRSELESIKQRLLTASPSRLADRDRPVAVLIQPDESGTSFLVRLLARARIREWLKDRLARAAIRWPLAQLAKLSLAGLTLGFAIGWYALPGPFHYAGLITGLLGGALPVLFTIRKARQRMRRFEEQFPDGLEFVSRSMRAGHAFSVSLEMLHQEFSEPLAGEFRRVFDEQNLGMPMEVALQRLSNRIPLLDVQFFVSAVLLQKRTGGNLAEVLDNLAYLIRERFKLRGRIRAVSAHGRLTGAVLSMVPAGVGGIMFYVNPQFGRFFLEDETGRQMIGAAILMQFIGYGIIKKIVSIEV